MKLEVKRSAAGYGTQAERQRSRSPISLIDPRFLVVFVSYFTAGTANKFKPLGKLYFHTYVNILLFCSLLFVLSFVFGAAWFVEFTFGGVDFGTTGNEPDFQLRQPRLLTLFGSCAD